MKGPESGNGKSTKYVSTWGRGGFKVCARFRVEINDGYIIN